MHRRHEGKGILVRHTQHFDQRICHIGELGHIEHEEQRHRAGNQAHHNEHGVQHARRADIAPGQGREHVALRREQKSNEREDDRKRGDCFCQADCLRDHLALHGHDGV